MPNRFTTLPDLVHAGAGRNPGGEAVVDSLFRFTYREFSVQVRRMAGLLYDRGVRKGDRVALFQPPSAAHAVALFGAIELGAIPVALHVRESDRVLSAILQRLTPRALVFDGAWGERAGRLLQQADWITVRIGAVSDLTGEDAFAGAKLPVIPAALADSSPDFEAVKATPEETAVIALSSGTTDMPKAVMHTHRTLLASARLGARYMLAHEDAVAINPFTTAFIGWYNCTLPFLHGTSKVVYLSRFDPEGFLAAVEREKATVCFLVPTMWRMVLQAAAERDCDFSSLQRVGYAGEPMDRRTMGQLRERICPDIVNTYGTTESGSWGGCTVMLPEDLAGDERLESVGRAAEEVELRVIRPGGPVDEPLPAGEVGEILISGPSVANRLWKQPELSRRIFDGRWWRSGDMGRMDAEGYLYLEGRVDDMIISGGINVFPAEVEDAVLSHPAVAECAVVGLPDERWGQRITAFVTCQGELTEGELADHVGRTTLAAYKRPREYRFLSELPRGNTGKVSRKMLRDRAR